MATKKGKRNERSPKRGNAPWLKVRRRFKTPMFREMR